MAHTPGPWEILADDDGKSYSVVSLSMTTKKTICYIYGNRAQKRKKIDARLIAASPEMLEALEDAEAILRHLPDVCTNNNGTTRTVSTNSALRSVRAAIAKAEGRS